MAGEMDNTELQQAATDLTLAASTLFDSPDNEFTLPSSQRRVVVRPATMRTIGNLMQLFASIITNMNPTTLAILVGGVSDYQRQAIAEGKDPNKLDMSPEKIIEKALGNTSILSELSAAAMDAMPKVINNFSDLTEDEFLDMPLDDATTIVGKVFMVNYDFFTQRLLPTLVAFARSRASKSQSLMMPAQSQEQKQRPHERNSRARAA